MWYWAGDSSYQSFFDIRVSVVFFTDMNITGNKESDHVSTPFINILRIDRNGFYEKPEQTALPLEFQQFSGTVSDELSQKLQPFSGQIVVFIPGKIKI